MKVLIATSLILSLPFLPIAGTELPYHPEQEEIVYEEQPVVLPETEEALDEAAKEKAKEEPPASDQPSAEEILDPDKPAPNLEELEPGAEKYYEEGSPPPGDEMHSVQEQEQVEAADVADEVIAEKKAQESSVFFNNVLLGIGACVVAIICIVLSSSNNGRTATDCNKANPCAS